MDDLEKLKVVIREAGAVVLSYYGIDTGVTYKKADKSPVTKADFASQEILIKGLSSYGYSFLSEELTDNKERLKSRRIWVIDPLDGTRHFLQNDGEFCVMVALVEDGRPIMGAIYVPTEDELYFAESGGGAYAEKDGSIKKISVSAVSNPDEATMMVSQSHLMPEDVAFADHLGITNRITCGSAGVKAMKVATGQAELYINTSDKTGEWDSCASDIIIEEAGGRMADMNKRLLRYNKQTPMNLNGFIVSNKLLTGIGYDD
jgi:3'(2'), 5'-bisphosphate nucleotidase